MRYLLIIGLLALSGCSAVATKTTVFYEPGYEPGGSIGLLSANDSSGSLESRLYLQKFAARLGGVGYTVTDGSAGKPDNVAILGWGVSRAESSSHFTRFVIMNIYEAEELRNKQGADREPILEARTVSLGECHEIASVIDYILDGMFSQWPGPNGKLRNKNIYVEGVIEC